MFPRLVSLYHLGLLVSVHAAGNIRQIYQFPSTSFHDIENVGIRPNGQLLLNTITEPITYILDPAASNPTATVLHRFDNATGLAGITQVTPDFFAVVVGNFSVQALKGIPGSFSIWTIDLTKSAPAVKKITNIPEGQTLNGMTTVSSSLILVADSAAGCIYSVNIATGAYQKAIQDPLFAPNAAVPLGVNGIHTQGSTLYFTNSAQDIFGSVHITSQGTASGPASIIAHAPTGNFYDDFALDGSGNAFITAHSNSIVQVITAGGAGAQFVVANSTQIIQPTAVVFGNAANTKCTLYVVTAGQPTTISGQVLAITAC